MECDFEMIIGGYKKDSLHRNAKDTFVYLDELSIVCTYEELVRIATFLVMQRIGWKGIPFPTENALCNLEMRITVGVRKNATSSLSSRIVNLKRNKLYTFLSL